MRLSEPIHLVESTATNPLRGNLLRYPFITRVLRSRLFPAILQIPTAAVFGLIMYQLLAGPAAAHDNFGTALTWVLWWPMIPIIFIFIGRFWCAICPFATLSDLVQMIVGNRRAVPQFLKTYGIWIIDAAFILITWSDHVWGIVESPWGSGVLLLLLTTGVVICGAFFERRTWCRYLCFLGGLSGNYARAGMLSLRATPDICKTCTARAACFNGNQHGPACPMFEFPRNMDTSSHCNLCAACVKTCPNSSIQLEIRKPTSELWFIRRPKFEEAFLAVVIMGIVFVQNMTMLEVWQSILNWLEQVTGTSNYTILFTMTFVIAMIIPIALLGVTALVAKQCNHDTLLGNFTKFGYAIIPLDMAGHVAHNLFHLLAEAKAIIFTAFPLLGYASPGGSTALVGTSTIQLIQYVLIVLGVLGSFYAVYRIAQSHYQASQVWKTVMPYAALTLVLGVMNIWLFVLPMSMRM